VFPTSKELCIEVKAALLPLMRSSGSWHALFGALIAKMSTDIVYRDLFAQDLAGAQNIRQKRHEHI